MSASTTGLNNGPPQMDKIDITDLPEQDRIFDDDAVAAIVKETDLPLLEGMTVPELRVRLEEVARQYYWDALASPVTSHASDDITFDEIADSSVTPSRLLDRLIGI